MTLSNRRNLTYLTLAASGVFLGVAFSAGLLMTGTATPLMLIPLVLTIIALFVQVLSMQYSHSTQNDAKAFDDHNPSASFEDKILSRMDQFNLFPSQVIPPFGVGVGALASYMAIQFLGIVFPPTIVIASAVGCAALFAGFAVAAKSAQPSYMKMVAEAEGYDSVKALTQHTINRPQVLSPLAIPTGVSEARGADSGHPQGVDDTANSSGVVSPSGQDDFVDDSAVRPSGK